MGAGAMSMGPGGSTQALFDAIAAHQGLQKLTILRPDGMGDPLRRVQTAMIARCMHTNRHLIAVHLRRCGMWSDTLAALVPPGVCPNVKRLKLDGQSLGYLSGEGGEGKGRGGERTEGRGEEDRQLQARRGEGRG